MSCLSQVAWDRGGRSHSMLKGQGPEETQDTEGADPEQKPHHPRQKRDRVCTGHALFCTGWGSSRFSAS